MMVSLFYVRLLYLGVKYLVGLVIFIYYLLIQTSTEWWGQGDSNFVISSVSLQ